MARLLIWYGFLGGAGAWALQLVIGYEVEDALCSQGSSGSRPWLVATTLVLGAVAAGSLAASFLSWREARRDPRGVVGFLAVTGMLAASFFLVLIALGGLQLLSLDPCHQG
jgi:hypothetical protein